MSLAEASSPLFRLVRQAAELVAPSLCAACDEPAAPSELLCAHCDARCRPENATERLPDGTLLISTGAYGGPLADAIRKMKYGKRADVARALGRRLAQALVVTPTARGAALVPVPLHRARLAERGFNQSALVAGAAARILGGRFLPLALARSRHTTEQAGLGRRERLTNVDGAFIVRGAVRGQRVIVVDDVVTTGATSAACVTALERAGAEVVAIAALARADRTTTSLAAPTNEGERPLGALIDDAAQ